MYGLLESVDYSKVAQICPDVQMELYQCLSNMLIRSVHEETHFYYTKKKKKRFRIPGDTALSSWPFTRDQFEDFVSNDHALSHFRLAGTDNRDNRVCHNTSLVTDPQELFFFLFRDLYPAPGDGKKDGWSESNSRSLAHTVLGVLKEIRHEYEKRCLSQNISIIPEDGGYTPYSDSLFFDVFGREYMRFGRPNDGSDTSDPIFGWTLPSNRWKHIGLFCCYHHTPPPMRMMPAIPLHDWQEEGFACNPADYKDTFFTFMMPFNVVRGQKSAKKLNAGYVLLGHQSKRLQGSNFEPSVRIGHMTLLYNSHICDLLPVSFLFDNVQGLSDFMKSLFKAYRENSDKGRRLEQLINDFDSQPSDNKTLEVDEILSRDITCTRVNKDAWMAKCEAIASTLTKRGAQMILNSRKAYDIFRVEKLMSLQRNAENEGLGVKKEDLGFPQFMAPHFSNEIGDTEFKNWNQV